MCAVELEFFLIDDSGRKLQVPLSPRSGKRRKAAETLSIRALDQFDEALSNDVLLSWKPSPGTVLFLGYREATSFEGERHLGERSGFAKFSWLWSL